MAKYNPVSSKPFRLSRSKIEAFIKCPCCFYLDRRLGVAQPPSYPFTLNSAVDTLLKKEFDIYRASGIPHPLMKVNKVDAVPFAHDKLDLWREALRGGVRYLDEETNLEITGAPDDIWINSKGELIVVDYKATSKLGQVDLDADWQMSYKRQVEIYQWLLRKNNFKVSDTAYFVYANGDSGADAFNHALHFKLTLIPYDGSDEWIEPVIRLAHECLNREKAPEPKEDCEWCAYRKAAEDAAKAENELKQSSLL